MNNYDVVIIGGGIHGCAAAVNAAHRGLSVLLVEKGDLASQTSSASSKLIHGGLRYLEQGEFGLVAQALEARKNLLQQAPHLVHPLAFVLPVLQPSRAKWQIRFGLRCYDFLARNDKLPRSRQAKQSLDPDLFTPLQETIHDAFVYYDAQTDDARLTIENALLAKQLGAHIHPRTTFSDAQCNANIWQITLTPQQGRPYQVTARALINTSGPWVNQVQTVVQSPSIPSMTLVKGSHFILPALYPGNHAYILQHPDHRIVFCIPYHGYTMVGTTDVPYTGELSSFQMEDTEALYLCELLQRYFSTPISPKQMVYHWSGVRTLLTQIKPSLSSLSRNAYTHLVTAPAPIVSLYGGKLTTHQHTANQLVNALRPYFPNLGSPSIPSLSFPGAVFTAASYEAEVEQIRKEYAWLPDLQLKRYLNQYGTRTRQLLASCHNIDALGERLGPTLFAKEIAFLCEQEWAETAEDILWRRSKLGLVLSDGEKARLEAYF